jgi:hypothetical protein
LDAIDAPQAAAKAGDQRLESPPGRCEAAQHIGISARAAAAQYFGTSSRAAAAQHAAYNRPLVPRTLV